MIKVMKVSVRKEMRIIKVMKVSVRKEIRIMDGM